MYLYLLLVTIGLLSGTLLTWPLWTLWVGLAVSLLALWRCPFWRTRSQPLLWLLCWLAGASWSSLWLEERLAQRLPAAQDRSLASLQLELLSAEQRGQVWRLQARVLTPAATLQKQGLPPLQQLQLNWYRTPHTLQAGQRWQADVLLRSPRNFLNNLPFDYEAFLLSRGVDATGYIRAAHLLDKEARPPGMRQRWLSWQQQHVDADAWPWVAGLVFGEQAAFSAGQWQLAQRTGTLHLLVVSGLHVGLMVLLALGLWWLLARLPLLKSGQGIYAVTLPGLLLVVGISAVYVWLAGAGIALQRAWVMLLVLLCLQYSRWRLRWPLALLLAVVVVLMVNPLIWTRPGFGLSFAAVLALLAFFQGRRSNRLEALWLPQLVVFVALLPLLLWWGQPVSLLQCVANLVAIPLLSLLLLPLALATALLPFAGLDALLAVVGGWFWELLHWLSNIPLPYLPWMPLPLLLLWVVWLLLVRRGVTAMALWPALALLLLWFVRAPVPQPGVMLMDVGQGQSMAFISPQATLLYDTGPRFSEHFDTGAAIVVPVLQRHGVRTVTDMIVSHADLDHAGGTAAILQELGAQRLWVGEPLSDLPASAPPPQDCHQSGDEWKVLSEVLLYRFLILPPDARAQVRDSGNNRSCVVQVQWYDQRFLLTGDISVDVEQQLVRRYGDELKSGVLVSGHHGSQTSSALAFLQTVAPAEVWISAGFNNRFGHPAPVVLERLAQLQIPWRNTAAAGALTRTTTGNSSGLRESWQPPWRQP